MEKVIQIGLLVPIAGILLIIVLGSTISLLKKSSANGADVLSKLGTLLKQSTPNTPMYVLGSILAWVAMMGIMAYATPKAWEFWWGNQNIFWTAQGLFVLLLVFFGKSKLLPAAVMLAAVGFFSAGLIYSLQDEGFMKKPFWEEERVSYVPPPAVKRAWGHNMIPIDHVGRTWSSKIAMPRVPYRFNLNCNPRAKLKTSTGKIGFCGPEFKNLDYGPGIRWLQFKEAEGYPNPNISIEIKYL